MTLAAEPKMAPSRFRDVRVLQVVRNRLLTPNMHGITLGGDELDNYGDGPNIKLLVPPPGVAEPEWPLAGEGGRPIWPAPDKCPALRTYSLRRCNTVAREIDVDFVMQEHGVGSRWASGAKPGDLLGVGLSAGLTVAPAKWYLLAGDHTALPAIARIMENLPPTVCGRAFIEVPGPANEQPIDCRAGIELTWLHRNSVDAGGSTLIQDAVLGMDWPSPETVSCGSAAKPRPSAHSAPTRANSAGSVRVRCWRSAIGAAA